jgi:uncharacterized FlgJ-related protein
MKKLMIPAVAIALFMVSCGSVKTDAEKICSKLTQMSEAYKAHDKAKIEILQKEYATEMEEYKKKYEAGSEKAKEFDALVNPCLEDKKKAELMADVEYICGTVKESVEVSKSGDAAKMAEFAKKNETEMKELGTKYAKGTPEQKEFKDLIEPCYKEAMKAMNEN